MWEQSASRAASLATKSPKKPRDDNWSQHGTGSEKIRDKHDSSSDSFRYGDPLAVLNTVAAPRSEMFAVAAEAAVRSFANLEMIASIKFNPPLIKLKSLSFSNPIHCESLEVLSSQYSEALKRSVEHFSRKNYQAMNM